MGAICGGKVRLNPSHQKQYRSPNILIQGPSKLENNIISEEQPFLQEHRQVIPQELVSQNNKCCFDQCQSKQEDFVKLRCNHFCHQACRNKIKKCSLCQVAITSLNQQSGQVKKSQEGYQNSQEQISQNHEQDQQNNETKEKQKECYGCDKSFAPAKLALLKCQHRWHEQCLYEYIGKELKLKCKCGMKIDRQYYVDYEKLFEQLFEGQIYQLGQQPKNHIKYCNLNSDCTFLYIDIDNTDDQNEYCPMCSTQNVINQPNSMRIKQRSEINFKNINKCYACKQPLFTFFIEINNCNHKYHLLCAQSLIQYEQINIIKCKCGQELNQDTKTNMMIQCVKCEKYSDSLILMDCMHYIDYNCLQKYAEEFSDFKCCECQFSVATCLEKPNLLKIKEKISAISEEKMQKQWLDPNFCIGCQRTGIKLIHLECKHSYHEECLSKMIAHKMKCANQTTNCRCGIPIKNQYQYVRNQIQQL